jgi:agmatinase
MDHIKFDVDSFDPNGPGIKGNLFGLPFTVENSKVIVVPVPWEVTVSYWDGTALGPEAILKASSQIDLFHREIKDIWKLGIAMLPVQKDIYEENKLLRDLAESHIQLVESQGETDANKIIVDKINESCENLNIYIKTTCSRLLREGKLVGILGGDHSSPLGLLRALSEKYDRFGILQIDAHADLRKAYEGFQYSHGSIMYNALKLSAITKIVQVGIRDFCEEEMHLIQRSNGKISTFFDALLKESNYLGKTWSAQCEEIIKELPEFIYVSFDIDGLNPKLCPHTGTPVPGGFELEQITFLIKEIVKSGKKIIGFDLCEVAPGSDQWDANVGARALWELCNWMAVSNKLLSLN